jgi:peptidoglycan/LPS O-acetylase OafA/YrhL
MHGGLANCTIEDIPPAVQAAPDAISAPSLASRPIFRDYLPALTGLRFGLAFWVILHHICGKGMMLEAWANTLPAPVLGLIRGGYLAVQTFFILSGFVLARTYARTDWNQRTLGRFATARFARIYPVYLLSLIVVSAFIVEMLLAPAWTNSQRAGLLTNYLFVLQGWSGALGVGWNTPAWTLSCEFFFYLCFPLFFAWLRNIRWTGIWVTIVVSILLPIVFDHNGVPWNWKPVYHSADFVAGIATARMFTLLERSAAWTKRGYWLYLPALVAGGWLIVHPAVVDGSGADLNTYLRPLNVALLLGLALGGGALARLLSTRLADFLGRSSYSMYVLHVPILWWYGRYYVHGKLNPSRPMAAAIYLTLVIAVSGMVFHWFEAPASVWIRARQKRMAR